MPQIGFSLKSSTIECINYRDEQLIYRKMAATTSGYPVHAVKQKKRMIYA